MTTPDADQRSGDDSPRQGGAASFRIFTKLLLPALTVATPILVGFLTWSVDSARRDIEASKQELDERILVLDQELKRLAETRQERESLQAYNLTVLGEVKQALKSRDEQFQKIVIGLLHSMPDKELAKIWLNTLKASDNTHADNRTLADGIRLEIEHDQEQRAIETRLVARPLEADEPRDTGEPLSANGPERPFDWEDYDYDIFWCEGSPAWARESAQRIVEQIQREGAEGRLRVRMLASRVNARPEYQVRGYQIRRNTREQAQAEALKRVGDAVLDAGAFEIRTTSQPTWFYLSAFICPNR